MAEYRVIGTSVERVDGPEMLTGQALYGPDMKLPNMLWGKILRSPIPHGKVLRVDVEKAKKHPGVKAVICARDVPARRYGYAIEDEFIFAIDKVLYVGQPVAAVAALDEETAEEALSLIDVDYEELPAVFDAEEAIRDGAPLVHEVNKYNARSVYLASWHPVPGTNIIHRASNQRGDVEAALKKADYVFEDTFRASQIHHSYMEPHATLVALLGGTITVWTCSQEVFELRTVMAGLFGVPESKMRVICTKVGGGFGGKIEPRLEPITIALAMKSGKPVKIVMTRTDEFTAAAGSTPALVKLKTGVMKDGTLVARDISFLWNTGAHAEGLAPSNRAMKDGIGPYRIPDIRVTSTLVYTNRIRGTQLRGLGVPEGAWAIESQMDMIAERLGMDSLQLRLKNILREGDINAIGDAVQSIGLRECLEKVAAENWLGKTQTKQGRARPGGHRQVANHALEHFRRPCSVQRGRQCAGAGGSVRNRPGHVCGLIPNRRRSARDSGWVCGYYLRRHRRNALRPRDILESSHVLYRHGRQKSC